MKHPFVLITALLFSYWAVAWETDQYTLPPQPIAETGEDVSRYISAGLQESIQIAIQHRINYADNVAQLMADLAEKKSALDKMNRLTPVQQGMWPKEQLRNKINQLQTDLQYYVEHDQGYYQTPQGMAGLVSKTLGRAIAVEEKKDAIWGNITELTPYTSGIKEQQPIVFYPSRFDSIYAYAGFHRILHPSHFVLSSTIKLYGIDIGMDKLGHIFNEGFQYYLKYDQAKMDGDTDYFALNKSVTWGVDTENSYYGRWVSGIYSNADLASNYAGLHFYLNLFSPMKLNGVSYPAILFEDEQGDYQISSDPHNQPRQLLKRFVSYHMNEALNPSSLEYLQYIVIKKALLSRCSAWRERYPDADVLNKKTVGLMLWNGDEYGFNADNIISIYSRCFTPSVAPSTEI